MPLSNSVIRRYTPPTCTLEVLAQSSPLSRWMGKPVLSQLTFELRFDDPQLPEESRVPIRGDRDQLEQLCDVVTTYVQKLLQEPPESFWLSFSGLENSPKVSSEQTSDFTQIPLISQTSTSFTPENPGSKIYLQAGNHLTHNLFLGSLANPASGYVIQLSLLQLFDLATALDEYSSDVMALPALNNPASVTRLPTWAPVAAVLVLALGLTPLTWQYANNTRQKEQQTAKTNKPNNEEIALQPAPSANFPAPQAQITPPNNLSPLPVNSLPPSTVLPTTPITAPNTSLTTKSTATRNSALIPNSLSANQTFSQTQSKIHPLASNPSLIIPAPQIPTQPKSPILDSTQGISLKRNLPPRLSTPIGGNSSTISQLPPPLPTIAESSNDRTVPNYSPTTSQQTRSTVSSSVNSAGELADSNSLIQRLRNEPKPNPSTEVAANSSGTLFDTPQVAQAREFLQKRWRPPAGFDQTLEYSLMVAVDGSVERVLPLGKAARDYVDVAGIPNIGEPFVSPSRAGKISRIRVVLSPDGKVQTFPENE